MPQPNNPLKFPSLFHSVCDQIVEELQTLAKEDGKPTRRLKGDDAQKLRKSVEKLVRDSVSVRFKSPPGLASVHKNANDYSNGRLGQHFSYRITVGRAFEGMQNIGYLRVTKPGVSDGQVGRYLTRYEATPKLLALFENVDPKVLPVVIPPDPEVHPVRIRKPIQKKDKGKPHRVVMKLPTPATPEVQQITDRLRTINSILLNNWFDLDISDEEFGQMQKKMLKDRRKGVDAAITLSKRVLYRVFNDQGLTRGGRFYGGWWQNIPSEYRPYLTINGKPMVEYDYSGLHPSILYAERGLEAPNDPYSVIIKPRRPAEGEETKARDVIKKIFNAMINSKEPMKGPPKGIKLSAFGAKWEEVSKKIIRQHEPIADAFYSDSGARLQRIDSDMAEEVMLHFAAKRVAVLPVHDSFLVHSGYESELEKVMKDSFKMRFGVEPRLKSDPRPVRPEALSDEFTSQDISDVLDFMSRGHELRLDAFFKMNQSEQIGQQLSKSHHE